jgi:hypothetical protein
LEQDSQGCGIILSCGDDYTLRVDATGMVVDIVPATWDRLYGSAEWNTIRSCVLQAIAKECFPCLVDGFVWSGMPCVLL